MRFATNATVTFLATAVVAFATTHETSVVAFAPPFVMPSKTSSSTTLFAVGALVKKAKEASLRQYIADGIEDSVMEKYKLIQAALKIDDDDNDEDSGTTMGPLQERLTRRKGTITVIAEFKRKLANSRKIADGFAPELLSPEFREFGAAGIAVMADERMGGCSYEDLKLFVEEQRRARMEVPGPVMVINNDIIIDEVQVARTAAYGAACVVLSLELLAGDDDDDKHALLKKLLKAAKSVDLEAIVAVSNKEDAQTAVDLGARIISVVNVAGADAKSEVINGLVIPEDRPVTKIANILSQETTGLEEVEEAWACRDKGFNAVWVADALYKAEMDASEHPGAIIRSMTAKSSLKWASPQARSGRGEGAREYLGDILM